MPSLQDIIKFFAEGWHVIRDAPGPFALSVIVVGLVLWGALSWKFDAQIQSRDSIIGARDAVIAARDATIKFQDALLGEYKNRLQIPTESGEDRRLTVEQKRILGREFRLKLDKIKTLVVYAIGEREPRQYAKQFTDLFTGIGVEVVQREAPTLANNVLGVLVGLKDPNNIPSDAKIFIEVLHSAAIEAHFTTWGLGLSQSEEEKDAQFDLFIARPFW